MAKTLKPPKKDATKTEPPKDETPPEAKDKSSKDK